MSQNLSEFHIYPVLHKCTVHFLQIFKPYSKLQNFMFKNDSASGIFNGVCQVCIGFQTTSLSFTFAFISKMTSSTSAESWIGFFWIFLESGIGYFQMNYRKPFQTFSLAELSLMCRARRRHFFRLVFFHSITTLIASKSFLMTTSQ